MGIVKMDMSNFTDRARGFVSALQGLTARLDHQFITPAHLLKVLVEDEEAVSSLLLETRTRQGYQVLPASNGREAAEIYRHFSREIDLIVTDVIMPEVGGTQLITTLH